MIWFLPLLITTAYAQVDLSAIKELDEELPEFQGYSMSGEDVDYQRQNRRFLPPKRVISLDEIKDSGVSYGAIKESATLSHIPDNKLYQTSRMIYVKYFNKEDEQGFKYLREVDGEVKWKIRGEAVEPLKEELTLYVPPHRYTPAPDNIVRAEYDKKLSIPPEASFYAGFVQGDYMSDLLNDNAARSGISNQFGLHFFTQWKLPIKAGGVLHYEKASYELSSGGQILYSSFSFGPQFKTREFDIAGHPLRFQTQFRVSPLSRASAETTAGSVTFKFNSADLLVSVERPIKNRYGEFVLGLYLQSQWLNLKDQTAPVQVEASNETNKSFGLSFAQVFE
ncbi:MAG: hypothetical protein ACLGHN_07505 [Bacteriovoracia bacterium]